MKNIVCIILGIVEIVLSPVAGWLWPCAAVIGAFGIAMGLEGISKKPGSGLFPPHKGEVSVD